MTTSKTQSASTKRTVKDQQSSRTELEKFIAAAQESINILQRTIDSARAELRKLDTAGAAITATQLRRMLKEEGVMFRARHNSGDEYTGASFKLASSTARSEGGKVWAVYPQGTRRLVVTFSSNRDGKIFKGFVPTYTAFGRQFEMLVSAN